MRIDEKDQKYVLGTDNSNFKTAIKETELTECGSYGNLMVCKGIKRNNVTRS